MIKGFLLLGFIVNALLLLTSCSKEKTPSDLQQYVQTINQRPAQPIPPLPKINLPTTYHINIKQKRDPFSPFANQHARLKQPNDGRIRQALEQYPLESLKMVGTIAEKNHIWGLIRTPVGINRVKSRPVHGGKCRTCC